MPSAQTSRVTRFPARAQSVADRMVGFMAHLRLNGMAVGPFETECALEALTQINCLDPDETRLALKSICAGDADRFSRFDDLFTAYWLNGSRARNRVATGEDAETHRMRPHTRTTRSSLLQQHMDSGSGTPDTPDGDDGDEASTDGEGKLIGSRTRNLLKKDLREFMQPQDLKEAERIAERLAKAIRDRRSRRRRAARKGPMTDLRKTARRSVSTGGEPFQLLKKRRPDRPVYLFALLDVSGSMVIYARVFLAFLKGLVSADSRTDAFLFHTRLVRISDALKDGDTFRAVNRLSMMAQGFGGGTKIGASLERFNAEYTAGKVNSRSVVIILSDGYDTDPPEKIGRALARLKKRGCKIIWLNPLKGWAGYEPVARGMAAALPCLDHFAAASTLTDLAALEPHLERL